MIASASNEKVAAWLADFCRIPVDRISADSRLREDFGVDGDDACELMTAFVQRFNVRWGAYSHGRYFDGEGFDITAPLTRLEDAVRHVAPQKKKPLFVRALYEAVERGEFREM